MLKMLRLNYFFLIVMVMILSLPVLAFPKERTCGIGIKVHEANSKKLIKNSNAFVIWNKRNRGYRGKWKKKLLRFLKLPEGKYDVFVTKKGYKQSSLNLTVSCDRAKTGLYVFSVPLWRGGFDKTISLRLKQNSKKWVIMNEAKNQPFDLRKTPSSLSKKIKGGVINGQALRLVDPIYPEAARSIRARGRVAVKVTINEAGFAELAKAIGGHPALTREAVIAAKKSRFAPVKLDRKRIKVTGIIVYSFRP